MTVGAVGAIVGSPDGTVAALQVDDWIVIHIVDPCMGGVSPTVSRTGAADLMQDGVRCPRECSTPEEDTKRSSSRYSHRIDTTL
jgi:hypothetical protein